MVEDLVLIEYDTTPRPAFDTDNPVKHEPVPSNPSVAEKQPLGVGAAKEATRYFDRPCPERIRTPFFLIRT